jgi:DNA-binding response OmpR family regulator
MTVAVAVRKQLRGTVIECAGEANAPAHAMEPVSGEQLRAWLHRITPRVLVVDEGVGGRKWKVLSALPRVQLVASQPKIIALMQGLNQRRELLAAMAGCYDAIDLTSPSWQRDLAAALRAARRDAQRAPAVGTRQPLAGE